MDVGVLLFDVMNVVGEDELGIGEVLQKGFVDLMLFFHGGALQFHIKILTKDGLELAGNSQGKGYISCKEGFRNRVGHTGRRADESFAVLSQMFHVDSGFVVKVLIGGSLQKE